MWKVLFISLALVQAIECRTNEDVINDFEPVFRERDEAFTALQNLTESTMTPIFNNFKNALSLVSEHTIGNLFPASVERIQKAIDEYIKILELEEYPELTKDCMEQLNNTIEKSRLMITAGKNTCSKLAMGHYDLVHLIYTDFIKKFENEHRILNVTREECVKLSTPFEVQTCVINDLYTFYIPYLKDVTNSTNKLIDEWSMKFVNIQLEILYPCIILVQDEITKYEQVNIDDAKICLWMIHKPKA